MEQNSLAKPKSCQYCINYLQHYIKQGYAHNSVYVPIDDGHCTRGVKGKRKPKPGDTCPYFEIGKWEMRNDR